MSAHRTPSPSSLSTDMRITHLGHACLLIETDGARLLVDPGNFSAGFEQLTDLDAILVTHQHPDHYDAERVPALIAANSGGRLLVEPEAAAVHGLGDEAAFGSGSQTTIGDVTVTAVGGQHARIHGAVPLIGNVGFLVRQGSGPTLFHPGDSYADSPPGVDVLALPLTAPWTKISETLEFTQSVGAAHAVPIHDGGVNASGRAIYLMHAASFGGSDVVDLAGAPPHTF
jgi:L-ascorbate metabolism protein UlaG (beta-lactamase superfamily)